MGTRYSPFQGSFQGPLLVLDSVLCAPGRTAWDDGMMQGTGCFGAVMPKRSARVHCHTSPWQHNHHTHCLAVACKVSPCSAIPPCPTGTGLGAPSERCSSQGCSPTRCRRSVTAGHFQQGCYTLHTGFGDAWVAQLIWALNGGSSMEEGRPRSSSGARDALGRQHGSCTPRRANRSFLQSCFWQFSTEELY